jgi:hypothetical protein
VAAELIGQLAATWQVTASAKLMELPHCHINTPQSVKVDTHKPHFGDFICKALFLSVVARCSLVGRVVRL